LGEVITMRRFPALALSVGVLATMYVAACVLPGEPSGALRIQFTLDSATPHRVPLAGVFEPLITISADGQVLQNPPYRLGTLDAGVVRVDSTGRRLLGVVRGTAGVRVTYLGATGTPDTVFSVQVVVSRVVVDSPALAFTRLGARTRLSAIALDANNAAVPNVPFTWSSATPTVAAVNDTGLVTAVDEGATTITAEADGVADTSDVTVTQVAAAVRVAPELDTVRTVGRSIQLVAVAFDSSNNVIYTAKPRWTSSDTTVGRVDATGRATATGAGTARIVARVGAAADTTTLVVAQVVRFLVVTPGFDTLTAIAETTRIVPLALDSLNFPVPTPSVTWATSDTAIATVDGAGLVRAAKNGVVLVTASAAGQSAFATIVVDQQVAAAQLSTDRVTLVGEGDTVRLSALGLDKNGYPVHTQANPLGLTWAIWHSGSGCVASLPGSEAPEASSTLVTARGAGETFIIAAPYTGIGLGRPDTATVTVTGAPAGEAEIAYRSNWGIQALCAVGGARTVLIWAHDLNDNYKRLYDFWGPAWSPDGARLAFYGESYLSFSCGLYIARADGSEAQRISDRCGYSSGSDRPAWSPDGTRLAFSPVNTGNSDQDTIYVVNADGSNLRPLFSFSPVRHVANPTWSPDGTQLAFEGWELSDTRYIYVMNADGSGAHSLRNTAGGRSPAWSPDGSQLAFGRSDIWLINPDGSGATNLTQGNGAFALTPAWSPDGSRLVFEGRILDSNRGHLFVINRDGTGLQPLDTGDDAALPVSGPTWRRRP
jgi:Bacterial Ig-like domain (group 2)/WD40-like Beta Propeller Repeat